MIFNQIHPVSSTRNSNTIGAIRGSAPKRRGSRHPNLLQRALWRGSRTSDSHCKSEGKSFECLSDDEDDPEWLDGGVGVWLILPKRVSGLRLNLSRLRGLLASNSRDDDALSPASRYPETSSSPRVHKYRWWEVAATAFLDLLWSVICVIRNKKLFGPCPWTGWLPVLCVKY